MKKSTEINYPILQEIAKRKSGRAYSAQEIKEETILSLLEAARWAPSSMNEQPWRYIVANKKNKITYEKVLAGLVEANQIWAKEAPVLLVSLAKKTFVRNGKPNRHALYDTGAANALLSIQAEKENLMIHQMGGINYDVLKSSLNISDDYEIAAVLSIGFEGAQDQLPDALKAREAAPRERFTIEALQYTETL